MRPTERFSDRVEDYVRYRPDYPAALYPLLTEYGLEPSHVIADLGAGTGLLARLFLERGHRVIGVEPNAPMREAGMRELAGYETWECIDGTAEETKLPDRSIDVVTAGQAFHWFDPERTRAECARILRENGLIALIWNNWHHATSELVRGYGSIIQRFSTDHRHTGDERLKNVAVFFDGGFEERSLEHAQWFDREGLRGRLLSSSYAPKEGHPQHATMLAELDRLFDAHRDANGLVEFELRTQVFVGRLAAQSRD